MTKNQLQSHILLLFDMLQHIKIRGIPLPSGSISSEHTVLFFACNMMHFLLYQTCVIESCKMFFFLHLEVKKLCAIEKMNDQALIIFHYHIHDMCLWQIDVHACYLSRP